MTTPSKGRKLATICSPSEWRAAVRHLQAVCPPPEGFVWRFMRSTALADDDGRCNRHPGKGNRKGTFVVRVAKELTESETIDTLIHEAAHAFDMWTAHSWPGDHGDTFWIWVGRIYRRYHGES